jgi:hypothetical protein
MTPNIYVKVGLVIATLCAFFIAGYYVEHLRFVQYKVEVEATAKEQEERVLSIQKQHELVTKGIQNEYDAKLALIRQYYANGVRHPSSNTMSNLSTTSAIANAQTAYRQLAEQCSETTQQLMSLQQWINEQMGIK